MAKYLIEETLTSQNFTNMLNNPEDRFAVLRAYFEAAGCNLEHGYASCIENKAYMIVESPDLNSVYAAGMHFIASGAASSIKYIPLITLPEVVDICKKAVSPSYRPPGRKIGAGHVLKISRQKGCEDSVFPCDIRNRTMDFSRIEMWYKYFNE